MFKKGYYNLNYGKTNRFFKVKLCLLVFIIFNYYNFEILIY